MSSFKNFDKKNTFPRGIEIEIEMKLHFQLHFN